MNKHFFKRSICTLASLAILAGCSTIEEAEKNTQVAASNAKQMIQANVDEARPAGVTRSTKPRITGREIVVRKRGVLPASFGTRMEYATPGIQRFSEVLEELSARTGMSVTGAEIVQSQRQSSSATTGQGQNGTQQEDGGPIGGLVQIEYKGTFKGLLDELAARNMASWRYVERTNSVEFFRFETRTFSMHLPAGAKNLSASISLSASGSSNGGGGGSGGGSSGGSSGGGENGGSGTVSVTQNQLIDPWTSVMTSIQAILGTQNRNQQGGSTGSASTTTASTGRTGGGGGSGSGAGRSGLTATGNDGYANATPELGIVTVTARPHALERIDGLLNSINARFARNVMIDVSIYTVTLNREQSAGVSMDLIYKKLNGNGLSLSGSSSVTPTSGIPGTFTLSVADPLSKWAGSQIVADALSTVGNVALYKKGQILAVNGQPSPFQVVEDTTYVRDTSTTQTPNVGSQTNVQQSTLTTGFTANVMPLILGDNRILLQYQMELSSVTNMTPVPMPGGATVYSPNIARQSFQQQAFLKDGDSIVLFGFDSGADQTNGATGLTTLGRLGKGERKMSVIVMQVSGGRKNG